MKKRIMLTAALAAIALVAAACTSDGSSSSGSATDGTPIDITMWHGYGKVIDNQGQTNYEAKALTDLVDQYNAMQSDVHVTLDYIGSNDHALEKLTVALQGHRVVVTCSNRRNVGQPGRHRRLTEVICSPRNHRSIVPEGNRMAFTRCNSHDVGEPCRGNECIGGLATSPYDHRGCQR